MQAKKTEVQGKGSWMEISDRDTKTFLREHCCSCFIDTLSVQWTALGVKAQLSVNISGQYG